MFLNIFIYTIQKFTFSYLLTISFIDVQKLLLNKISKSLKENFYIVQIYRILSAGILIGNFRKPSQKHC